MTITHEDLGVDEDLGRRIMVRARIIAPCIDSFPDDSQSKKDAIAILKGVIAELPDTGSRRARSLSRNGTAMTFDIGAAFTDEDRSDLASLCGAAPAPLPGLPMGSFPAGSRLDKVWPEGEYT